MLFKDTQQVCNKDPKVAWQMMGELIQTIELWGQGERKRCWSPWEGSSVMNMVLEICAWKSIA